MIHQGSQEALAAEVDRADARRAVREPYSRRSAPGRTPAPREGSDSERRSSGWRPATGRSRSVRHPARRGERRERQEAAVHPGASSSCLLLLGRGLRALTRAAAPRAGANERAAFWTRQGIRLFVGVILLFGVASIWFDDPTTPGHRPRAGHGRAGVRPAEGGHRRSPGTSSSSAGKTFNVGDRIAMGGVRGDVIALGFTQTTIMEMGQPPAVQGADPAMWVQSRQYTGRVVTVSQRQDLRRAGVQLHPRVPVPLGGDAPADRLHGRPRAGRADPAGGRRPARRPGRTSWTRRRSTS